MIDISVIVPVYNVEAYLERCLESMLSQTISCFDIILIDDGSTDNSSIICDEYAKNNSRIHVIHQKNSGPSVARNAGIEWALKNSSSKYLAFVDSDDSIQCQYLEFLYKAIKDNNANVSMCQHKYITNSIGNNEELYECMTSELIDVEELMIKMSSSFNYAWGKLFEKKLFCELRYPIDVFFGEDNLIIYKAMFSAERVVFIQEQLYFYYYNANGITKSTWTPKSLDVFKGIQEQLEFYKNNGYVKAYEKEMELYIQQCAYQIHRIVENKKLVNNHKDYILNLKQQMRAVLEETDKYHIKDNLYWYEALYPKRAIIVKIITRIKNNINEYGMVGTINKLYRKILE